MFGGEEGVAEEEAVVSVDETSSQCPTVPLVEEFTPQVTEVVGQVENNVGGEEVFAVEDVAANSSQLPAMHHLESANEPAEVVGEFGGQSFGGEGGMQGVGIFTGGPPAMAPQWPTASFADPTQFPAMEEYVNSGDMFGGGQIMECPSVAPPSQWLSAPVQVLPVLSQVRRISRLLTFVDKG